MSGTTTPNLQPPARPGKPRRRFARRLFAVLVVLLLLASGLGLFFRLDLVNRFAPGLLSDVLEVPSEIAVSALNFHDGRIEHLRLGEQGSLSAEGVNLAYDPWQRHLTRIEIDRVRVAASYRDGFSLGELDPLVERLQSLVAGDHAKTGESAPLPVVVVKTIEVDVDTAAGMLQGSGQATLDNNAVIADFVLRESGGHAEIDLKAALSLAEGGAPPSGSLKMTLDAQSGLWPLMGLAQPGSGSLDLTAVIRTDRNWQEAGRIDADWEVKAAEFLYPGLPAPVTGSLRGSSSIDRAGVTLDNLTGAFEGAVAPGWVSEIAGNLAARFAVAAITFDGQLALKSGGDALSLTEWGGGNTRLTEPSLSLTTEIVGSLGEGGTLLATLAATQPLRLTAAGITSDGISLPEGVRLEAAPSDKPFLQVTRDTTGGIVADITLALVKTGLAVEPRGLGDRLILAMPNATLTARYESTPADPAAAFTGTLELKKTQIAAPRRGITLGDVALAASFAQDGLTIKLSSGAVAGLGAFVPLRAEADARLAGGNLTFEARFRGLDQPVDLKLAGKADLTRGSGSVDVTLAPIEFAAGALQPYNLMPPLSAYFDEISGRIEAKGPIRFEGEKLSSALKLGVENFSGKVGPVQLLNVNSVIEIDNPWPLSTKPDQQIAIERADIGLPLTDALFRFKVSDGKRLELAESRLAMTGGAVRMDPVTLELDAPVHNLRLTVESLAVDQLFASLGIAGLTGEGSLSGVVPVSIFPGGIAIPAAELKADAPGALRYDKNQAPLALQSAGDSVAMALQALSDFHYKELILTLARNLTGDVNLGLHISGSNPSFYDGYPVEFNLSVEGRLDQALREGLAGYQVPDMIQEQLENLAP